MQRLTGVGVSPGLAVGRAVLLRQRPLLIRFAIGERSVDEEIARLQAAQQRSRHQLEEIRNRVQRGPAADLAHLFDAQLLMLDDPMLVPRALARIREQRVNAEWALQQVYDDLAAVFDEVEDPYLRERKGDVADVVGRLRVNLGRERAPGPDFFREVTDPAVLVADDLTPSVAAQVDWHKIRGFASDAGSRTHHTAILARSLGVPAVVALGRASTFVQPGTLVVIDGTTGELLVDPPPALLEERTACASRQADDERSDIALAASPAMTSDDVCVSVQANIELLEDVALAERYGADGIGLYRSEFLLTMGQAGRLTENVQFDVYSRMVSALAPRPVTIRTFDIDEDQWESGSRSAAPASAERRTRGTMGLRAVRLCLARRDMFREQLRALLRAAAHGRLRIMLPFISSVEEVREVRRVIEEARTDLTSRGLSVPRVPLGIMIETPSAAATADLLAREVDFLSIGTNDLIQYSLAVDRTDPAVSHLYAPLHPAILRTIRSVVRAAARRGVPLSLCGEMAADPAAQPVLIGLGLRELSMAPAAIPAAKRVVRQLKAADAQRLAAHALRLSTATEVERYLAAAVGARTEYRPR